MSEALDSLRYHPVRNFGMTTSHIDDLMTVSGHPHTDGISSKYGSVQAEYGAVNR
jgi:hypothetical protein